MYDIDSFSLRVGFPGGSVVKNPAAMRPGFNPWVRKGRRKWQPAPVFLPGKSHGQKILVGYSPWGCKESDTTEQLSTPTHMHCKV